MLDINWIKANPLAYDKALSHRKNVPFSSIQLLGMDDARRAAIVSVEEAQAKRNALSKEIGRAKAQKDEARATELMDEVAALKDMIAAGEAKRREAEEQLRNALLTIPNLPLDDVPEGEDEADNREYFGPNGSPATAAKARPAKPSFAFKPKEHYEIGEASGQMDFEVAAKLSGSRFVVLKSHLARLERAIGQFMLDLHVDEHGYTEVEPPLLVKDDALYGTNQLPKFEEDLFKTEMVNEQDRDAIVHAYTQTALRNAQSEWAARLHELVAHFEQGEDSLEQSRIIHDTFDFERMLVSYDAEKWLEAKKQALASSYPLYLIPTAEVPLTNLVRESIVSADELPLRYTALTPCFRSEAGSAGRDTRGMLRQHQFNKVEMVAITTPETSRDEHEKMLSDAEDVLRRLGLHYRVMTLSTGDMGFGAQKTYDIEVWLPGQDTYREISSVSVCGDFQARRMNARYRPNDDGFGKGALGKGPFGGGPRYVHTLNGSGVAVGRCLIAVMENYQREDGSIEIPEPLQPYMKGLKTIGARS